MNSILDARRMILRVTHYFAIDDRLNAKSGGGPLWPRPFSGGFTMLRFFANPIYLSRDTE